MNEAIHCGLVNPTLAQPSSARDERARVLFLHLMLMGHATYAGQLMRAADRREDIRAVHVAIPPHLVGRVLGRRLVGRQRDMQRWRMLMLWRLALTDWLSRVLAPGRFDAVHCLTRDIALAVSKAAARTPWVLNTDSTAELERREFGYAAASQAPMAALERRLVSRATAVACWSRWAMSGVESLGARQVVLAPPGVEKSSIGARPARADLGVRIGFVGRHWIRKGGPRLLAWHQALWARKAELHVFSGGAKPDASAVNVFWHGEVDNAELLRTHLPAMDIVVLPTREDAFGICLLEASAAGAAVVASRIAATPEVVDHGRTGYLCSPRSDAEFVGAIGRLVDEPTLAGQFGRAGRERALSAFSADVSFSPVLGLLARVGPRGASDRIAANRKVGAAHGQA